MDMLRQGSKPAKTLEREVVLSITSIPLTHCHSHRKQRYAFLSVGKLTDGRGGFINYLLEREDVQGPWKDYTEHDFVLRMADGTLPVEYFKHYLIQDYLFLVSYREHV